MTLAALGRSGPDQDPMEFVKHHSLDEVLWSVGSLPVITKFSVMVLFSGILLLVLARLAVRRRGLVAAGVLQNGFESVVLFIRDEMVRPAMGHHGDRFVSFFCTLFSFILVTNLAGLLPIPWVGGTATSNLALTGLLAAVVFCVSVGAGIANHGLGGFLHNFIPAGLPGYLKPLLFALEIFGFLIRHGVLAIRLFANMLAGHLVVGAFFVLIFMAGKVVWQGVAVSVPVVGLALFFYLLEILVCVIQAYVFTLLSVIFVGGTVHPEH